MRKREIPVMNVGISLIILIFMNICLAAFAVLSLQNALSDYSLSKKTAEHTTQYYKAVNKVQEQLAEKNKELKEAWETQQKNSNAGKKSQKNTKETQGRQEIKKAQTKNQKNTTKQQEVQSELKITESASERQQLVVTLQVDKTGDYPQYYIEKWQLCSPEDWQADDSLDVYKSEQ